MAPVIELPSSFEDAEKQATFEALPILEDVEMQVVEVKLTTSKKGERMLVFKLELRHADEEFNGRKMFHRAMLEGDGYPYGLVEICHATGYGWEGSDLQTEEFLNRVVTADIGQEIHPEDKGKPADEQRTVNTLKFQ